MWVNVEGCEAFDYLEDLHGLWHPGVEEAHVSIHTANTGGSQRQAVPRPGPAALKHSLPASRPPPAEGQQRDTCTTASSANAAEFPLMSLIFGTIHKALSAVQTALLCPRERSISTFITYSPAPSMSAFTVMSSPMH